MRPQSTLLTCVPQDCIYSCNNKPCNSATQFICNPIHLHKAVEMMLHKLSLGSHRALWRVHGGWDSWGVTHPPNKE